MGSRLRQTDAQTGRACALARSPPSRTSALSLISAPRSPAATTSDDDDGFTFAAVPRRHEAGGGESSFPPDVDARIGPMYPVFGRPRWPPPPLHEASSSATARVPLGQLLLAVRPVSSSQPGQPNDDDDGELDGVPAETYCLWSPAGGSPAAAGSRSSPAVHCEKSGSTGSVLRWRRRFRLLGRSHSDGGKDRFKFAFLMNTGRDAKGGGGNNGGRRSPYNKNKKDLVGLFANAGAFRRSYHPF